MSTTDTRAAFERIVNAPLERHSIYTDQYDNTRTQDLWSIFQAGIAQAASEAAKATGTADQKPIGMVAKSSFGGHKVLVATAPLDDAELGAKLYIHAARQPAPVVDHLKLICAGFGWRTDGDSNILADRIEHHIRDLKAGIKARDTVIAERDAALAATAAPVVTPDLSDDTISYHLNQIMKALHAQVGYYDHKARNEAKAALRGAIIAATRSQP